MSDLDLIIQMMGGIGNQLFQYAVGRRLQIDRKANVRFDLGMFNEHCERALSVRKYRTELPESSAIDRATMRLSFGKTLARAGSILRPIIHPLMWEQLHDPFNGFDPGLLKLTGRWYLSGWWQSPKYFDSIRQVLLDEYQPADALISADAELEKKIINVNAVSVHIRRGDYVTDPKYSKEFKTQSIDYYNDCMHELQDRLDHPQFFIFSDDPNWAKQNIADNGNVTYVGNHNADSDFIDLYLMSRCHHFIAANSTFSWWAAWLSRNEQKIVIVPPIWRHPATGPPLDLVPNDWQIGPKVSTELSAH